VLGLQFMLPHTVWDLLFFLLSNSLILFLYCCTVCGYIIAFTKVLSMYQIYHNWIPPLHCCPSSLLPWFLEQFQHVWFFNLHTCAYVVCTIFILLPLSHLPLPHPWQNPFYPPVLQFCRRKNTIGKTRNMTFCLFKMKIVTPGVSLCCFHEYVH
jgi:hypothetical protein